MKDNFLSGNNEQLFWRPKLRMINRNNFVMYFNKIVNIIIHFVCVKYNFTFEGLKGL